MAEPETMQSDPSWWADGLPGPAFKLVVELLTGAGSPGAGAGSTAAAVPRHQAHRSLAALRSTCRTWRVLADDAVESYTAPWGREAAASAPHPLFRWRNLRELVLEEPAAQVQHEFLAQLEQHCPRLEALQIVYPQVEAQLCHLGPRHLAALGRLTTLRRLHLIDAELAGGETVSLAPLHACTRLESFALHLVSACDLTADVAALVRACSSLAELDLYRCVRAHARHGQQPFDLGPAAATTLTSLALSGTFTECAGWEALVTGLPRLAHLNVCVSPHLDDAGLLALTALASTMTFLALRGPDMLTPNGLTAALAQLPGLRSLELSWRGPVPDRSLLPMVSLKLTALTQLDISGTMLRDVPLAFDHTSSLRHLRVLSACYCGLGTDHLATVGRLTHLTSLNLLGNELTTGAARHLGRLRQLAVLELDVLLPSVDVSFLSSLRRLQNLTLSAERGSHPLDEPQHLRALLQHLVAAGSAGSLTRLVLHGYALDSGVMRLLAGLMALQELCLGGCWWSAEHPTPWHQEQERAYRRSLRGEPADWAHHEIALRPEQMGEVFKLRRRVDPVMLAELRARLPHLHMLRQRVHVPAE